MIVVKNDSHYPYTVLSPSHTHLFFLFSSFLGAYVIFAIGDSIFHFTGDKAYISMLHDFLTGLTGG